MGIKVNVVYTPEGGTCQMIRTLFCSETMREPDEGFNPLIETPFNDLLGKISQMAFDEGRNYERNNKAT